MIAAAKPLRPVLITGGAGYIGSHLALMLRENGYPVIVFDNLSTGRADFTPWQELVVGDILDTASLTSVLKEGSVGTVVHLAAKSCVPESFTHADLYFRTNVDGTESVARACAEAGVGQIVFSSTAAVYGNAKQGFVCESDPVQPISPYGESKLEAEKRLDTLCRRHGIRQLTFRYFNVIGAHPEGIIGPFNPDSAHLLQSCMHAARNRMALEIFGNDYDTDDGSAERDYIHVQDLVSLHMHAIANLESGGSSQLLNAGYGKACSVLAFIESFRKVTGVALDTCLAPRRAGDPAALIADVSELKRNMQWRPRYDSIDQMIESAWLWENSARRRAMP